ncbi:C-type lectin domain family 4 member E-like [Triplophysa dalaica]|uniref:C-type lectin domain family 4 member E-like n=1 Tax=Triplophysa dalaica TaxID=1582913 RepID=UPI0024E012E4|nr:C-type lectin domain family 4 member E-like [Triplophysa dalaica]
MDAVYENSPYIRSTADPKCKSSKSKGQAEATPCKRTKVLLIVLCVSVVLLIGGLCVLGVLYSKLLHEMPQDMNNTNYKMELEALNTQYEETLRKLNRLNASTGCALCAVNWTHFEGKCYFFSTVKMNWTLSRDHCVTLGGHLVIIDNNTEQAFLTSNVKITHWIGLNDIEIEGRWVWVNNQPLNDSIEFWIKRENGVREPDNWIKDHPAGEDCASLGHPAGETDFWTDAFCFQEKRFVCEAPASV